MSDYFYTYSSPIGTITMASDGSALTGVWFNEQKHFAATLSPSATQKRLKIFDEVSGWLDEYFSGNEPDFMPEIRLYGTEFQLAVWEILKAIPYGETTTYGAIAKQLAENTGIEKMSAQAVGGAVGKNPISILVPCHRVLGANGSLTGYAGGIDKKKYLLEIESKN